MNEVKDRGRSIVKFKVTRSENGVKVWIKSKEFEEFFKGLHPKNSDGTLVLLKRSERWGLNYYAVLSTQEAPAELLVNNFGDTCMMNSSLAQASFIRAQGIGRDEVRDAEGNVTDPGGITLTISTGELVHNARIRQYREALKTGLASFYRDFIAPVNVSVDIITREGEK